MRHYDYCILGAGLAGILLGYRLAKSHKKVLIIDPNGVASGASSTPLALANPATGRFAKKGFKSDEALESISKILDTKSDLLTSFITNKKLIRPFFDEEIAEKTKKNIAQDKWINGDVEWLAEEEIQYRFPLLNQSYGGVIIHNSYVINPSGYLKLIQKKIEKHDGLIIEHTNFQFDYHQEEGTWYFEIDSNSVKANELIHCTGDTTLTQKEQKGTRIKGQTLSLSPLKNHPKYSAWTSFLKEFSISAQGYLCTLDHEHWVVGSTYEHRFTTKNPDEKGRNYLMDKLRRISDDLPELVTINEQWAGIRYSTPDRKPLIGTLDHEKKEHIFRGLASKGVLYAHLYSECMCDYLIYGRKLPKEVTIDRYL